MENKRNYSEEDYNYYHKLMERLFTNYKYNPHLMGKPSVEFVLDIMQLSINYFNDLTNNLPILMNNPEHMNEDHGDIESKSNSVAWQLLSKCNGLLREFNLGLEAPELFAIADIVSPNNSTVVKIMFTLNICFHVHELDFTEPHGEIQEILAEFHSIQDSDVLINRKMELEVASECLQHKLTKLKGREEMERLYNVEAIKCETLEKQLKEEIDMSHATVLQRRNELEKRLQENKNLQDKLVDDSYVENLKSDLETLKLKSNNQIIDGENLITKINKSRLSKEFLEFQFNNMDNELAFLKKQKEYLRMEDELKTKLDNILHINADLKTQIANYKEEKSNENDLHSESSKWKEQFEIRKANLQADTAAEEKKRDQLQSDVNKTSAQVEKLLIDMENKSAHWENVRASVKTMDTEVKMIMDTMLEQTLERCQD